MRALPDPIALALDSGVLIGDYQPQVRVSVEPAWFLNPVQTNLGSWPPEKSPIRYWQRAANDQAMTEVPNVKSVTIDRNVATPAAACEIVIDNVKMEGNMSGHIDRFGLPGYYTPTRGATAEAVARWGQEPNEWFGVLEENSLLRTYEGVGDDSEPLADALDAGRLMLSGVWLVDDWRATHDGVLTLSCRDMMSVLIDQIIYLPLVPASLYPLTYYRWDYINAPINAGAIDVTVSRPGIDVAVGDKRTVFRSSSVTAWYPNPATRPALYSAHAGEHSVDGSLDTFALSVGNSSPTRPFCTDYFEYDVGEAMNSVWFVPWKGNYTVYISIMENGVWQGDPNVLIPYDFAALEAVQPGSTDTGADIPYVTVGGCGWETATEIILPRVYNADRMRITFRDHTQSPWGPWFYRCGVREIRCRATTGVAAAATTETVRATPVFFGGDYIRNPDDDQNVGYITTSMFGQVDAFGDAVLRPPNGTAASTSELHMSIRFLPDASGYYIADHHGTVLAFGNAVWYGDPKTDGFQAIPNIDGVHDIAVTPTGLGYWVVTGTGKLFAYGDATDYADVTPTGSSGVLSIDSHPTSMGLVVLDTNGAVTAYGAATNLGNFNEVALNHNAQGELVGEAAVCIRFNLDGTGYWIATNTGRVQNFGTAVDHGQQSDNTPRPAFFESIHKILPAPDGDGYLLLRGDGQLIQFGDVDFFGSPVTGTEATLRRPGNYLDYVDIVKDILLWSGYFLAFEIDADTGIPDVYGNLESTGAFAPDTLPMEMFDKKPPFDPIKQLAELVGYIFFVDEEGGVHWHTPNWWNYGNFDFDGVHTTDIHELDERWNLTGATIGSTKANDRSEIIISTEQPTEALDDTVTTRFVPPDQSRLRGMCRPAMWVQGALGDATEQLVMAELVSLHLWFRRRTATVQGLNHPGLSINDQVRILDRATGETSVHYVLSKRTRFDRETREWLMELTTHWLGDRDNWAVSIDGSTETFSLDGAQLPKFALSARTISVLEARGVYIDGNTDDFITRAVPAGTADPPGEGQAT